MKSPWKSMGPAAAVIILLTIVAYMPALRGGFIFDDYSLITENQMVKAGDGLYRFWFTTEAPDYYPLTWSLWWSEWRLWGKNPVGFHVVNVLLHTINALLIWLILRRLKIPGAWTTALVFAVHPVNVATVAWISEQKNTLSMLFFLIAILLYLRFDEEDRPRWYMFSLAAFVLALLSKTAVVMLPAVLLGCVWWRRGKLRGKEMLRSVPFFVFSLISGLVTIWFQHYRALGGGVVRPDSFAARLAAAGWVPWFYLEKALLPLNLTVVYPKWQIDASRWVSYVPGIILIGCFVLFWWKRRTWGRALFFGLGYFVATLFPVLGFLDQGFYRASLVADHWQYYSIVGPIVLAVTAMEWIGRRLGKQGRYWGAVAGVMAVMVLTVGTWRRSCLYMDDEKLWRDNVIKNPSAWGAYHNLGCALQRSGKPDEAIRQFEHALLINPDYADTHNNLAVALAQLGKLPEALAHWEQALRLSPAFAEAHNNLGNALSQEGKNEEAIGHYNRALQARPNYSEAHHNLGASLAQLGRFREAIGQYEQALKFKSNDAKTHYHMGIALGHAGKIEQAIGHLEQALRIKPDYAEAHYDLGIALMRLGKMPEAMTHWEQALRLNPDYEEAHYNLGIALGQAGRIEDAIGHFEQALRSKPAMVEAHYDLGIALVRLGKIPDAMVHWEQVLQLKPDHIAAHNDLANALLQLGRTQEAIGHYEQALRLKPEFAAAHNNLGIALTRLGRVQEAIPHFEQALQISPDYLDAHYNLGIDLERVGRTNEAVAHYEQALRIKPDYAEAQKRLERLRAVR